MSTPTFAKTHNLIAYLAKPTESERFEQIINFLTGSSVSYALTTSPTIRTSCIKQFWTTTKVKDINDEVMIQALIDEKRVNIKESSIHRTLKLDDVEGTSCLANACLSAKTTSWNEFSSTMASAMNCLATNQKFNFSRYILLNLVKNMEDGVPFFMFPRFVQLLIDHLLDDMSHHKDIYDNPSLTKKVFTNMKRVGTGFSRVVTLLFDTMLVPAAEEVDRIKKLEGRVDRLEEENRNLKDLHNIHSKVDTAAPVVKKEKSFKQERIIAEINKDVEINLEEAQAKICRIDLEHRGKVLSMQDVNDEELAEVEEVLEVVKAAKLMTKVVTTAGATKVSIPKRRKGVVIQDPEETTSTFIVHSEVQSKDKGKGILIEEPKSLKGQAQIEQDEEFARQLEEKLNAYIKWNVVMEQVKRSEKLNDAVMKYQASKRKPLTEAKARKNMIIYLKNMAEEVNEEVIIPEKEDEVQSHKREGKSLEKEVTKKQKMDEEAEDLKSHLQIIANDDDDDVYTKATPLASKIHIVDYKIYFERNKPYFKIIRTDKISFDTFHSGAMLNNVRLKVEEVSEMSLELLRLVRI
uniref:Synaptobrevin, longin-like domain protein n=1 Tax=Tanacetum cinerariifolium TaxID=118510 RepID=A0A6L2LMS3_TANCI|nr:hypothetical protein [Tanacetum cinerariifolium]